MEDKIINLGSLGFTTDDLIKNWNEAQAEMKDSDKIDQINVRNGEFKHDVNDGMILEGIVNETTNEVIRLSIVKKTEKLRTSTQLWTNMRTQSLLSSYWLQ